MPALKDTEWLKGLSKVSRSIDGFFSQVNTMVEQVATSLAVPLTGIARASEQLARPIQGWQQLAANIPSLWDFGNFREGLRPIFEKLEVLLEDVDAAREVLKASEFGFANHFWTIFDIQGFAHIDPRVRNMVVTNKLAALTSSEDFVDEFRDVVSESKLMTKRWRIIESALEAHAAKKYDLAVPATLAQFEGVLVEFMFLKDVVKKDKNKFYLVDENGNFKTKYNKKTEKYERLGPVTLGSVPTNKLKEHPDLAPASEFFANTLIRRRNQVLHGRDLTYGKAKFSVQIVLMLTVLTIAVSKLESQGAS